MRTSLAIAALFATPVLCLTACDAPPSKPVKGTVTEIEYEPAKTKVKRAPVTVQTCTTPRAKKIGKHTVRPRATCTSKPTGRYATKTITIKKECYEVDVHLNNGRDIEFCDEATYRAVTVHGPYDSAIDYSARRQLR